MYVLTSNPKMLSEGIGPKPLAPPVMESWVTTMTKI